MGPISVLLTSPFCSRVHSWIVRFHRGVTVPSIRCSSDFCITNLAFVFCNEFFNCYVLHACTMTCSSFFHYSSKRIDILTAFDLYHRCFVVFVRLVCDFFDRFNHSLSSFVQRLAQLRFTLLINKIFVLFYSFSCQNTWYNVLPDLGRHVQYRHYMVTFF